MYGTEAEQSIIDRFRTQFPEVSVENPNQQRHQEGYRKTAEQTGNGMKYFTDLAKKLDGCFLATFADGTVGAGAAKEVLTFLRRRAPVWVFDMKSGNFAKIRSIADFRNTYELRSVEATRAQLARERAVMQNGQSIYSAAVWQQQVGDRSLFGEGDTFLVTPSNESNNNPPRRRIGIDERTAKYYQTNAEQQVEVWEKFTGGISDYFAEVFAKPTKVLDVGMGSGRDMARLAQKGHDVYGVEPVAELRRGALRQHPELLGRIWESALPTLGGCKTDEYEGLVCGSVLMHVDPVYYADAARNMRRVIKKGGDLLICVPTRRDDVKGGRDDKGRSFHTIEASDLTALLEQKGFQFHKSFENEDELRSGVRWWTGWFKAK
ncbi:MAG: hypothetical protein A2289_20815 [Deltaproteobacteria bacterium RIFOXYA12_FULL_58_15]|nr:MAG: hypothetical protein A2289_20815 [Deltaproteobacteria bacterium RIFOXYA12_FULL_58_15]OGR11779.1 MAG: hypothetical protein A2341_02530 [Deltaproteobacteria bacterium RIFOXYB12_FULL_58_9]